MATKEEQFPIKISADSAKDFETLVALVKALPESFLKQFESIEIGLSETIKLKGKPRKEEVIMIGVVQYLAEQKEKFNWFGMQCTEYSIGTNVYGLRDKPVYLALQFILTDGAKFSFRCSGHDKQFQPTK